MDNSSSERSPSYTDSSPGSFGRMKFWENDVNAATQHHKPTYPSFGLDNVKEIEGLVEDKDVASKAVTFVVNGTRKGVVRLCADVAGLMRAKKRLEQTVEKQRRELEHLRSLHSLRVSTRTSRSTSPTLPPVNSDGKHQKQNTSVQSVCSQCSPASSYISTPNSVSLEQSLSSLQSKESSHSTNKTNDLYDHQQVIRAEIHTIPDNIEETETPVECDTSFHQQDEDEDSDPVTIVEPSHPYHSGPLRADCKLQSKLEEDLEVANQEIEMLKLQLKDREVKENELKEHEKAEIKREQSNDMSHKTAHETACEMACEINVIDETRKSFGSELSLVSLPQIKKGSQSNLALVTQTSSNLQHSCNCHYAKCKENKEGKSEDDTNSSASIADTFALEHRSKRCNGHSVPVELNDRVVIRGGRIGHIRYIGPLNHGNGNTKTTVYLGLQLEEPHGHHDGIHSGKRYFWCHRNHGIFIPVQDVLSVIKAKACRPQTGRSISHRNIDSNSKGQSVKKRERSGSRNRVGPALLPTPPSTAKPNREFLANS
ncbi:uncharacterized protein [Antedon mediterranea]|uniref:uncharacterized protein n=1 Tax=Antedon mediterranea TaxID=105859 RepID=UPI003AF92AB5